MINCLSIVPGTKFHISLDQECTFDTEELKEIIRLYMKESLLLAIARDIKKKQKIYEKAKSATSISDIVKLREYIYTTG